VGPGSPLLCIKDSFSGQIFLVDTGAQVSVLPATDAHRAECVQEGPRPPRLQAANGSVIQSYGTLFRELCFRGRVFSGQFVCADVRRPLLGADFLLKNNLLVDIAGRRLMHADDLSTVACVSCESPIHASLGLAFAAEITDPFASLLRRFPEITQPDFALSTPKHGVMHHIPTKGPPVWARPRRLDPAKLMAAKK